MNLGTETVDVYRPTTSADRYGNDAPTYGATADHSETGVAVEPTSTSEVNDGRTAVTDGVTLYMPAGADVEPSDHLTVRGATYEVVGEPAVWTNAALPGLAGVVVQARRVAG